jgi:ABC-type lipoprotein release transport system permease subunit
MKSQRRKLPLRRGLMGFLLMLMVVVAKFLIAMAVLTLRAPVELGNP